MIANATVITVIIIIAIHLGDDVGYRSRREFLLELQRVYDVAIYSVFGTIVFLIITNLISLAIRLKVTAESVDYITEQVNQQCKEYEETVRRFVRDAFLVRKYYEIAFAPVETLSVEQATLKQKQERTVAETVEEISKQLTTLDKMNAVVGATEEKQLDTKFLKLIKELHKTGQIFDGQLAKRFKLIKNLGETQEESNKIVGISSKSQAKSKHKSRYVAELTQTSAKDQESQIIEKTQFSSKKILDHSILSLSRIPSTGHELRLLSSTKADQVLQDFKTAKTQSSSNRESKRISEVLDNVPSVKMKSFSKSTDTALEKSMVKMKRVTRSPEQQCGSPNDRGETPKDSYEADTVKSSAKVETESINALSEVIEKLSVGDSSQSVDGIEASDKKENETKE